MKGLEILLNEKSYSSCLGWFFWKSHDVHFWKSSHGPVLTRVGVLLSLTYEIQRLRLKTKLLKRRLRMDEKGYYTSLCQNITVLYYHPDWWAKLRVMVRKWIDAGIIANHDFNIAWIGQSFSRQTTERSELRALILQDIPAEPGLHTYSENPGAVICTGTPYGLSQTPQSL